MHVLVLLALDIFLLFSKVVHEHFSLTPSMQSEKVDLSSCMIMFKEDLL